MKNIDFLTVVFASVIYFVMYIVWYSNFLFRKIYVRILGKEIQKSIFSYIYIFIAMLFVCYILAAIEILLRITTFWDGVFLGFLVWFGFVFTHSFFLATTFKRKLKLFFIDNLLYLLSLMIVAGILAG